MDFEKKYKEAQEEIAELKADLADKMLDAEKWVKLNAKSLILYAGLIALGFALGAALV